MRLIQNRAIAVLLILTTACTSSGSFGNRTKVQKDQCMVGNSHPHFEQRLAKGDLARFDDRGAWTYRGHKITGAASLRLDDRSDGGLIGHIDLSASSDQFKLHSQPRLMAIFADVNGVPIHDSMRFYMSVDAMGSTGYVDRRAKRYFVQVSPECHAAYVLVKFRFCGFKQDFSRNREATNCPGRYVDKQLVNLRVSDLQDFSTYVQNSRIVVGQEFRFGSGWNGWRIR